MRELGIVERVSASGKLIVRLEKGHIPRIRDDAFIEGKKVGFVYDIIGPVKKPWVLIDVEDKNPKDFVGKRIFVR